MEEFQWERWQICQCLKSFSQNFRFGHPLVQSLEKKNYIMVSDWIFFNQMIILGLSDYTYVYEKKEMGLNLPRDTKLLKKMSHLQNKKYWNNHMKIFPWRNAWLFSQHRFFWDCLSRCQHSIFPLFLVSIALETSRNKIIWITISSNGVNTCVSVSDCMLWHHTFSTLSTLLFNKCLFSSWAINLL